MKSRSIGVIFVVAVILPSVLLAVLSIRAAGREEAFIEKQLAATLLAEVTQTAGLARGETAKMADELRAGLDVPADGDYARILPRWRKSTPLVAVPFLLSPRYGVLWPRADAGSDDSERRFLRENGDFLSDRSATTILQNIAVKYQKEILAQAGREESASAEPKKSAPPSVEKASSLRASRAPAPASTPVPESEALSQQRALDAFAQSPEIQTKVYQEAREKGDTVSPRVAQPLARIAQNAAESPQNAPPPAAAAASGTTAGGDRQTGGAAEGVGATAVAAGGAGPASSEAPADSTPAAAAAPSTRTPGTPAAPQQQSQFVVTSRLLSQIASQGEYGLIPRFVGDRLEFLFWERQKDGRIAGCEVSGTALRQRIAGVLSATYTPVRIITILDENGMPLATPPDASGINWRLPFVAREIGESLPRWEAASYLASPDVISTRARSSSLVIWILVLILFVSISGGGTMVLSSVYAEIRLARKKATFVANVSHELKTPLTSISLFIELLRRKRPPDAEKRDRYLALMAAETERLTRLINNVLDFSGASARTRQRRGADPAEPVDAARVAQETVETQRVRLQGIGFRLAMKADGGKQPVRADPEALKQVILNLLSNAEKYSPDRKEIEVEVRREAPAARGGPGARAGSSEAVCIHVRDRGIGVAEREREKIFREFYRVDESLTRRVSGTGLGLTIARRIVRGMAGELICAGRPGGGSDFIIRLPLSEAAGGEGEA